MVRRKLKKRKTMKKVTYILTIVIAGILFSCETDDTSDVSRVTNYPIITLNGAAEVIIQQGETYNELGAISTEGGSEIETVISYGSGVYESSTGIDSNTPDNYVVNYSATNQDGFAGSALRSVWVANTGDLTTSIEGLYTCDVQRAPDFIPSARYDDLTYVLIWKTGDNTYEVSHAIGGYYDLGRGYGPNYAARGAGITANDIASNDFSFTGANIPGFGLDIDISEFTVDATSKMITYTGSGAFGNGTFKVQLTQVQF